MIEKVHSHEGEERTQNDYTFRLPKNIKQIGESTSQKKIYVEDYVFTYIKELVKKEYSSCKIAVLLGKYVKTKEERIILINGAIEAEGTKFDAEVVFSNDTWTDIYEKIKRYFRDVEVVGWCIGGPGFIMENEDKLKKIHLDNFAGVDKTLLKYDSIEGEEAFYIYENGTLNKQKGYYIYYDKNEDMQSYIIDHRLFLEKGCIDDEQTMVDEYKEEIREQKTRENNRSIVHLMYAAGSLMVVIVIVVFTTMINNTNKINELERTVDQLSNTLVAALNQRNNGEDAIDASTKSKGTLNVETISGNLSSIKSEEVVGDKSEEKETDQKESEQQEKVSDKKVNTEVEKAKEESSKTEKKKEEKKKDDSKKDTKEASNKTSKVKYYEVQQGDSLVGISYKLYNSRDYVTKIMELNGIEDMDMIYYGQKLIVP